MISFYGRDLVEAVIFLVASVADGTEELPDLVLVVNSDSYRAM